MLRSYTVIPCGLCARSCSFFCFFMPCLWYPFPQIRASDPAFRIFSSACPLLLTCFIGAPCSTESISRPKVDRPLPSSPAFYPARLFLSFLMFYFHVCLTFRRSLSPACLSATRSIEWLRARDLWEAMWSMRMGRGDIRPSATNFSRTKPSSFLTRAYHVNLYWEWGERR